MNGPLLFVEIARRFENAVFVVEAYDLLEERWVSAGEHHSFVDEIVELRLVSARGQQVMHHHRRVDVAERRQLDHRVPIRTVTAPAIAPREHLGAGEAPEEPRGAQPG